MLVYGFFLFGIPFRSLRTGSTIGFRAETLPLQATLHRAKECRRVGKGARERRNPMGKMLETRAFVFLFVNIFAFVELTYLTYSYIIYIYICLCFFFPMVDLNELPLFKQGEFTPFDDTLFS